MQKDPVKLSHVFHTLLGGSTRILHVSASPPRVVKVIAARTAPKYSRKVHNISTQTYHTNIFLELLNFIKFNEIGHLARKKACEKREFAVNLFGTITRGLSHNFISGWKEVRLSRF